jgi:hypothetical protein
MQSPYKLTRTYAIGNIATNSIQRIVNVNIRLFSDEDFYEEVPVTSCDDESINDEKTAYIQSS